MKHLDRSDHYEQPTTEAGALGLSRHMASNSKSNAKIYPNSAGSKASVTGMQEVAATFIHDKFDPNHRVEVRQLTAGQMNWQPPEPPTVEDLQQHLQDHPEEAELTEEDKQALFTLPEHVRNRLLKLLPQSA